MTCNKYSGKWIKVSLRDLLEPISTTLFTPYSVSFVNVYADALFLLLLYKKNSNSLSQEYLKPIPRL